MKCHYSSKFQHKKKLGTCIDSEKASCEIKVEFSQNDNAENSDWKRHLEVTWSNPSAT